jgi:uncharacterized membrane protein
MLHAAFNLNASAFWLSAYISTMEKNRMEAFSDGVLAIIITIMVLELKVPHGDHFTDLLPVWPIFLSYLLSFIYVGIYWNNHHHMMYTVKHINGSVLWANLNLLFWLSLIPFVTAWMGENHFSMWPVTIYGIDLLMCALSYSLLLSRLLTQEGPNSLLARAVGKGKKGKVSVLIYVLALGASFINSWISFGLYGVVAVIWFIPDKRIESKLAEGHNNA